MTAAQNPLGSFYLFITRTLARGHANLIRKGRIKKVMEKILYRRLSAMFYALTIVVFLIVTGIMLALQGRAVMTDLDQMMADIRTVYDANKDTMEELKTQFSDDYYNRALAIEYMLELYSDESWKDQAVLQQLSQLMEVESIHLMDENGVVQYSSSPASVGLNLMEHESANKFWPLFQKGSQVDHVIELEGKSISSGQSRIYVGIRTDIEGVSVLQIGVESRVLGNLLQNNTMEGIIEKTPTLWTRTIFLVNRSTGELTAITPNNDQVVEFADGVSGLAYVHRLEGLQEGGLRTINGMAYYVKTTITRDGSYVIGAMAQASSIHEDFLWQVLAVLVGILIVMLIMFGLIRRYLRRYVLDDLQGIERQVVRLLEGDYDVEFTTRYNTELRIIALLMNDWRDSYRSKAERMTRIMRAIDQHVGAFECLLSIHSNFFSDNLKQILGLSDGMWSAVSKSPQAFRHYIRALEESRDPKTGMIQIGDRYVEMALFESEDAFYGMVMDRTTEIRRQQVMELEAETDSLTGLTNRAGVERQIAAMLANNPTKGILLLFDMDRFKSINDSEGHPEGDKVLRKFAAILRSYFRKDDVVGRLGGDEFIVFVSESVSCEVISNKMHWLLETILMELRRYHETYGFATSVGIAYADEEHNTYESLYASADSALYIVKNNGKNGFYIADNKIICPVEKCKNCTLCCKRKEVLVEQGLLPPSVVKQDEVDELGF